MKEILLTEYIQSIKHHKQNVNQQITSLSSEVQAIFHHDSIPIQCSLFVSDEFLDYLTINNSINEDQQQEIKFLTQMNNQTIFQLEYFTQFISILEQPQVEHFKPIIDELLSLQFSFRLKENRDPLGLSLYLTTQIEKMITTIHKHKSTKQLPRTLSETLQLMFKEQTLPQELIVLCSLIIGPPVSLNIRNLLWHGFLEEYQITSTILGLIIILFQTIQQYNTFELDTKQLNDIQHQFLSQSKEIEINSNEIIELIHESPFILPSRKDSLCRIISQNSSTEMIYHQSILRLIVEIEHLLRIAFITVNDVEMIYGMANYSSYYTTMDILLQEDVVSSIEGLIVNRPSTINDIKATKYKNSAKFSNDKNDRLEIKESIQKNPNKLPQILGKEILSQLHDLFLHEGGMKLRDCLSHGEYDIVSLSNECEQYLHYILFVVLKKLNCWYFNAECIFSDTILSFQHQFPTFHPLSFCKRIFNETQRTFTEISTYFNSFDYSIDQLEDYRDFQQYNLLSVNCLEKKSLIETQLQSSEQLFPLFGEPLFLSNIKHSSILFTSIQKSLSFIKETHQLFISLQIDQTIKRRQANALFKLLNYYQELLDIFNYLISLSSIIFYSFNQQTLSQLLKFANVYSSKLFVLLEKYCFEDYVQISSTFFKQISKYSF